MILCFSPVGEAFRVRARRFPALVNSTIVDWFHPWPEDVRVRVRATIRVQIRVQIRVRNGVRVQLVPPIAGGRADACLETP